MKVLEIRQFGIDNLVATDRPDPKPGPGHVLIRVGAASLNYRDLMMVEGRYNPKQRLPLIPLSDGVGEVIAIGEGVTRVKAGDRVAGNFSQKWISGEPARAKLGASLGGPLDGWLAEHIVLHEEGVVHVPAHLSDEEAAALPCAAVTAWHSLIVQGRLKAGDSVLIQGTGGVSIFALQFASMMGARAIVTSSSDAKLERAKELGASELINYRTTPDWEKTAREMTGGLGVDHVVEVGGAGTLSRSLRAVRVGGHVSMIGVLAGNATEMNVTSIVMQNVRVQGILVGSREMFEDMNRAITQNKMKPVVDRVFGFDEAREALRYMASGAHFGKICIRVR
jgi:NADPH:quinone reductase-like Zn-dependent oxidoreductase